MAAIEIDKKQLKQINQLVGNIKKGAATVIRRGVNRTVGQAKTLTSKEVRTVVNLKKKTVDEHLKVTKANFKSLSAKLTISGRPISLVLYGARRTNAGVNVKVRKSKAIEKHKSSFIATMKSGHRGVYVRTTKPGGRKKPGKASDYNISKSGRVNRLHIDEKYGPSIPAVFQFNNEKKVSKISADNLQKNIDREILYLLSKQ